jgi:hypothetical protein
MADEGRSYWDRLFPIRHGFWGALLRSERRLSATEVRIATWGLMPKPSPFNLCPRDMNERSKQGKPEEPGSVDYWVSAAADLRIATYWLRPSRWNAE